MIVQSYKIQPSIHGEHRTITRFTIFRRVGDKLIIFGRYTILQIYVITKYTIKVEGQDATFFPGEWLDISFYPGVSKEKI